ncbi:MAG: glycosyltransferase, partial [Clostridiales bacterium]|nr:glycosyltransferase [Clostridiales bacterium]
MRAISVIVPVYNAMPWLEECLNSILSQSFSDFELILIDDGSTDGSAHLCDACAARDERVRVVHQKNSGVAAARNRGLDESGGQWIAFVDADDV